jgi:hypothetical protein
MEALIRENSIRTTFTGKEFINGRMEENTLEIGRTIKWMVKVLSHGSMEENIKDRMLMIKSMDMVNFTGQMGDAIEDIGLMENNMGVEFIEEVMESKEKENGMMGKN